MLSNLGIKIKIKFLSKNDVLYIPQSDLKSKNWIFDFLILTSFLIQLHASNVL